MTDRLNAGRPVLCRACLATWTRLELNTDVACPTCGLTTLRTHQELFELSIAHIDCDAFYASVEKRDNPELRDKPVIVGGTSGRGVVTTACYVARRYGPRSAMPMFKALQLCPDAVVIKPDMAKYKAVSLEIRQLMQALTPVIEPLSLDEAYLDLADGVRCESQRAPAVLLAELAISVKRRVGISISIGLAANKFLAKLASDMDKPRGYFVIGRSEAENILAPLPVSRIHGIGPQTQKKLEAQGITEIRQLQAMDANELRQRFGTFGDRLACYIRGDDPRSVNPSRETKSVSAETTFGHDLSGLDELCDRVAPLCDRVAQRLLRANLAGQTIVLKLKTADFRSLTRNRRLSAPTLRADLIYQSACQMIARQADGRAFRLIGVGVADLHDAHAADPPDLFARLPVAGPDADQDRDDTP